VTDLVVPIQINWLDESAKKLVEAGRVISTANEAKIRGTIGLLHETLKASGCCPLGEACLGECMLATKEADDGDMAEAQRFEQHFNRLREGLSFNDQEKAIRAALNVAYPNSYCWLRDVFPDEGTVIYSVESKTECTMIDCDQGLWQCSFTIDADGNVALSSPVKVVVETSYVPATESIAQDAQGEARESIFATLQGDLVPLMEATALRRDGTMEIKIIQPGWGTSGYYSADVLKRDGPKVFTEGLQMFLDHPTVTEEMERPERSVRDLAASLVSTASYKENHPDGPGLYADALVQQPYRDFLADLAPNIGVSINAEGKATTGKAEGRDGRLIQSIEHARSVDFVTAAGAGGQICQLYESRRQPTQEDEDMTKLEEAIAAQHDAETKLTEAQTRIAELEAQNAEYEETLRETGKISGMGAVTPATGPTAAESEASLVESFKAIGLDEKQATIAARGR